MFFSVNTFIFQQMPLSYFIWSCFIFIDTFFLIIEFEIWNIIKKGNLLNPQKNNINQSWDKLQINYNLSILKKKIKLFNLLVFKLIALNTFEKYINRKENKILQILNYNQF